MDSLIALDVAILPPPSVAAAALALSAALPPSESQGLRLDDTHLPHITLTQQFITADALPLAAAAVARVVAGRPALALSVTGPGRGSHSVWMQIGLTAELRDLHRDLMTALQAFERAGGGPDAFAGGDARPGDVAWVANFRTQSSYDRFTPHITLGHAKRLPAVAPVTFVGSTVAVCHLGRFCSCRRVLHTATLGG